MNPVAFVISYTKWHYSNALLDIIRVWGNFLWLSLHFFSTGTLLRTFFSPFMRMHEEYPGKGNFDPEYFAGTLVVNIIMRIVGILVRTIFIVLSVSIFSAILFFGIIFIALWITAPIALSSFITLGLDLIILK